MSEQLMEKITWLVLGLMILAGLFLGIMSVSADSFLGDDFESYSLGDLESQSDWNCTGVYNGTIISTTTQNNVALIDGKCDYDTNDFSSGIHTLYFDYRFDDGSGSHVIFEDGANWDLQIHFQKASDFGGSINEHVVILQTDNYVNNYHIATTSNNIWHNVRWTIDVNNTNSLACVDSTCTAYMDYEGADGVSMSVFDNLEIYGTNGISNPTMAFDNVGLDFEPINPDTVTIVELDDIDDNVLIAPNDYEYLSRYTFNLGTTGVMTLRYPFSAIGDMVLLLPETATSVMEYVDIIYALEENDLMTDFLTFTTRSSTTTDYYRLFIAPETGSSTLSDIITVVWQDNTDVNELLDWLDYQDSFWKRIFPMSLWFQITNSFNDTIDNYSTRVDYKLSDIIPSEYSGLVTDGTILSSDIIEDNLSIWSTHIYPYMKTLIWLITLIYTWFRLSHAFNNDDI